MKKIFDFFKNVVEFANTRTFIWENFYMFRLTFKQWNNFITSYEKLNFIFERMEEFYDTVKNNFFQFLFENSN